MSLHVDALTLDFYDTLVHHRQGRGRGAMLMDYLRAQGFASDAWEHAALYDIFARHATEYDPALSAAQKQRYLESLAVRVFDRLNVTAPAGAAGAHAEALWAILGPAAFAVFPEVVGVLRVLKRAGYPLVVVSNWQSGLKHFCVELGLAEFLDGVLASAELGIEKPDPGIFRAACRVIGSPPHRVLHVGDSVTEDLAGARAAGMPSVLVRRGDDGGGGDVATIASLDRLPGLLGLA